MTSIDPTTPLVKSLIMLDSEGKRVAVKYYSQEWPTTATQANYEKTLWNKTRTTNARQEAEIVMFEDYIVVYKYLGDLMFYVTGSVNENELMLYAVLQAFYESVSILLRSQVEKKTVLENLDLVLLAIDETIDGGMILETDPQTIASRATMRDGSGDGPGGAAAGSGSGTVQPLEKTLASAFLSAKEHLTKSLLR
ncbi:hypothetical protein FOA52_012080 [Chlamydomonas sp. UWO 241]|nr:hypothetical protein FOA52_012080 [Chlamydomonas sp. UWO 241]